MPQRLKGFKVALEYLLEKSLDIIYPGSSGCPLCNLQGCNCRQDLLDNYRRAGACTRCGKFLNVVGICPDCTLRGPGFPDRVLALGPYQGNLRQGLHKFKYHGERRIGKFLAKLLLEGPLMDLAHPDLIVPVPLHPARLRQRGYNQALVLAERLSHGLGVSLGDNLLLRVAPTHPQSLLQKEDRRSNLINAFKLARPELVNGKSILLVDDIITTGSTLEACGTALRKGKIAGLEAVCVAAGSS